MIRLDARLRDVIDDSVFSAELYNGHRFIAVAKGLDAAEAASLRPSDCVSVEFSPYDMSTGQVVSNEV